MRKLFILFAALTLSVGMAQAGIVYHSKSDPTCEQYGYAQDCWEDTQTGKIYANQQCNQELNPAVVIRYEKLATSPISYLDTYTEKEDATYAGVPFYWAAERGFWPNDNTLEEFSMEFTVRDNNPTYARIKWYKSSTKGVPDSYTEHYYFYVYINNNKVSEIEKEHEESMFVAPLDGLQKGDVIKIAVRRSLGKTFFGSTTVAAALEYCSPHCGAISDITITPTAPSLRKAQGTADPEFSYKVDGNIFPNIPLQSITVTRTEGETPGTYTVTASCPEGANPNYNITFRTATFTIANTTYHKKSNAPDCQTFGWTKNCWEDLDAQRYYTDALLTQEISRNDVIIYPSLVTPCWTPMTGVWNQNQFSFYIRTDESCQGKGKFTIYGKAISNARLKISYRLGGKDGRYSIECTYGYRNINGSVKFTQSNNSSPRYVSLPDLRYSDVIEITINCQNTDRKLLLEGNLSVALEYLSENCGDNTKRELTAADFVVDNYNGHTYDGTPKAATVTLKEGIEGAGDITVTYKQGETVVDNPINAGNYDIYVSVTEGYEYKAIEEMQLVYGERQDPYHLQILQSYPTEDMFFYTAPTNLVYDGNTKHAKVDFDTQDGKLSGMGPITLKYKLTGEGQTEATGWTDYPEDPGTYQVYVDNIGEGTNYHMYLEKFTKDGWLFTITQGTLTADDFDINNTFFLYDGTPKAATVKLKQGITGAGTITAITYQQGANVVESPTMAGEYDIYVSVAEGTCYAAVDNMKVGKLTISLSNYFYIENKGTGSKKIGMKLIGITDEDAPHIAYSKDGVNWTKVTYSTDYSGNIEVYYTTGNKVYFRACDANDPSLPATNTTFSLSDSKYIKVLSTSSNLSVGGNIMSLLKGSDFESMTAVPSYAFCNLFKDCGFLQDASALVLPATQLADYCYASMFYGCTNMTAAPELPATTLVSHCYESMFDNCQVLQSLHVAFTDWNNGAYTKNWLGSKQDTWAGKLVTNPNPKFYCPLQLDIPSQRNGNNVPQNWDIVKPALSVSDFVVSNNEFTYDGTAKAAAVDIKEGIEGAGEMTVTYKQGDEEVTPINAGEYAIFVSVAQGEKYTAFLETQVGTLTIAKATPTADLFTYTAPEDLVYDGNAKTAKVTSDDQDGKLSGMGTITVKYNGSTEAPVAPGTYTVSIDVAEGLNYTSATGLTNDAWTFTIAKATPTADLFTASLPQTSVYDGNARVASCTFIEEGNMTGIGTVTIKYNGNEQAPINAGDYTVSIDVAEGDNFTAATGLTNDAWTFTIAKATPTADLFTVSLPENLVYGGNEKTATVTFNDQDGKLTGVGDINVWHKNVTTGELNFGPVINIGTYQVYLSIAEGDNYYARMSDNKITDDDWQFTIVAPTHPIDIWVTVRTDGAAGNWNTICLEHNITAIDGATFWTIVGQDATSFILDEVTEPEAGQGYLIRFTATELKVKYGDETADNPVQASYGNPIQGTFEQIDFNTTTGENELVGNYVVYQNQLCPVEGWVGLRANRAYVVANLVPGDIPAQAPGRARVYMSKPKETPTELEPIDGSQCTMHNGRYLHNGQLIIVKDGKRYNALGF